MAAVWDSVFSQKAEKQDTPLSWMCTGCLSTPCGNTRGNRSLAIRTSSHSTAMTCLHALGPQFPFTNSLLDIFSRVHQKYIAFIYHIPIIVELFNWLVGELTYIEDDGSECIQWGVCSSVSWLILIKSNHSPIIFCNCLLHSWRNGFKRSQDEFTSPDI